MKSTLEVILFRYQTGESWVGASGGIKSSRYITMLFQPVPMKVLRIIMGLAGFFSRPAWVVRTLYP
ncbi:hypothetical protein D3C78_728010 [compost metagenome]